jgi:hypothetical protein
MYILSIPAFTWVKVKSAGQNIPAPRAGHTCSMRDGQMLVVGGYVGKQIPCDSPGIYVFNATSLQWTNRFVAGDHEPNLHPENSVMAGSFGYRVPDAVQSVIGGNADGSATATTPAAGPATGGPFATGKPPVFTVTRSGQTATITQWGSVTATFTGAPDEPGQPSGSGVGSQANSEGSNPGLIAAGVIAGLFGLLAGYLGFCAWVYRRQVAAYRQHLAVANRYSGASTGTLGSGRGPMAALFGRGKGHHRDASEASEESFGWVGAVKEPKWQSDEPTPGSNTGSGSGTGTGSGSKRRSEDRRGDYGFISGPVKREHGGSGRGDVDGEGDGCDGASVSSAEQLLDGQEPSFFSVVMGPRRALRVVNGID